MQSMHRLGAPEVSPDGRWAVFTLSDTDWAKNKRSQHALHARPDQGRRGAAAGRRAPRRAMTRSSAPTARFWFLMAGRASTTSCSAWRSAAAPVQVSNFNGDIGGFKLAPSGDRVVVWADRDLRCADLDCAGLPAKPKTGIGPHLRPAVRPPLGHLGRAGRRSSRLFAFPVAGGKLAGGGVPLDRQPGRRHAVQAVRRRRGDRFLARRPHRLFRAARGGPDRADVDQPRHLRGARATAARRRST